MKSRRNLRVWEFRYYESLPDGTGRSLRAVTVGTVQEYPSEAAIRKSPAVQAIVLRINAEHPLGPVTASTVGALIARYEQEELPARYSTRVSYQSIIDVYIRPRWAETSITAVKPMAVEDWLKRLKLAPRARGHIRGSMATIFRCAQRWELIENNPMDLVRVKDSSKRLERPSVLTAEEFHSLVVHIREPYRTLVLIAGCLGLRAGEIVGLQWGDFDFQKSTLLVQRGVVHGRVDGVRTEYSRDSVPLAPELAAEWLKNKNEQETARKAGKTHNPKVEGSNPSPATTLFKRLRASKRTSKTTLDHDSHRCRFRGLRLWLVRGVTSRLKYHLHHFPVCLPFAVRHCPAVDIHGCSECWHGASIPAEPQRVRPSDPTKSGSCGETSSSQSGI